MLVNFISNLIGNDLIATVIMSLVPLIELKGGIVFSRSAGFSFFEALGLAFVGSTVVFFFLFFLLKPILNLLKKIKWFRGLAERIEDFFIEKAEKAKLKADDGQSSEKKANLYKQIAVFIFVAIPLPMTGVWTGTAIAVFLGMKFKDSVLPIALGNLVAGIIISLLAELCIAVWNIAVLDYVLWGLFALALVMLTITIIKLSSKKKKDNSEKTEKDGE